MIEVRNFVGGLDKDSNLYDVQKGWYLDALNISKNAVAANNDFAVTNIVGNRLATYTLPAGTNKCIGAFPFELRGTVIYFVYNSNGNHCVLEFTVSSRATVPIFISKTDSATIDILNFTEHDKITSVNVYPRDEGDLLFFLDSLGRPTQMDITLFKAGAYTPVTRQLIDKGKMPPLAPPSVVYDNDATRRANNLRKRLFRFKYRWIYDDNEKSTFSPISQVPLPVSILSDVFTNVVTNNNVIRMTANAGGKNVKSVEIAMSYAEATNVWSDFQSVEMVNKAAQSITDDADFAFAFYNDSTYPDVDIQESILLFDWIPDTANAQEMPNGNVLAYAGITEGYDKDTTADSTITVSTVAAGSGGSVGNLDSVLVSHFTLPPHNFTFYTFSGIPATGTTVQMKVKKAGVELFSSTYVTIAGDTSATVASQLAANNTGDAQSLMTYPGVNGASSIDFRVLLSTHDLLPNGFYSQIVITPPTTITATNSIASWKWSTERNIGRIYFDQKGKTNGVLYTDKVTFPAYAENGSQQPLIPYINYQINDVPPDWAYSFAFAATKEGTQYIFWETIGMDKSETDYIYFDVTNFDIDNAKKPTTAQVLSYTFQDGDRLRLIRRMSDNTVFPDTYDAAIEGLLVNPKINGIAKTGKFIRIKKVEPFTSGIGTALNYVIEIYRPAQQEANKENQVYYEFGRQYYVLDPTLAGRRHSGQVTDQTVGSVPAEFNFYEGDAYFRGRTVATSDTGYATFNVMDRNFVDFYISAVSSIDGRPNIIDINAKRQYYSTLIRFGQAYQANTNINGLNRFYPNNFDEYSYNYGDITRLKVRDKYLKVFQKFKIGVVPLFSEISKDASGNQINVVTDKLLNPIQYRSGNFGLTAPESLASWHFADYGCDTNKGVVWRDSQDGLTPISEIYKINSWATVELPQRTGNYKIYGAINPQTAGGQYIFALEPTEDSEAQTLCFSEQTNTFDSPLSYHPEFMTNIGTMLVSFKDGVLYSHDSDTYNRFYGVDYPSYITAVFNQNPIQKKTFVSVIENGNTLWLCPYIETQTMSYGSTPQQSSLIEGDFENIEGQWNGAFLRDVNSISGIINGDTLVGKYIIIKFSVTSANNFISLNNIQVKYLDSPLNAR